MYTYLRIFLRHGEPFTDRDALNVGSNLSHSPSLSLFLSKYIVWS